MVFWDVEVYKKKDTPNVLHKNINFSDIIFSVYSLLFLLLVCMMSTYKYINKKEMSDCVVHLPPPFPFYTHIEH